MPIEPYACHTSFGKPVKAHLPEPKTPAPKFSMAGYAKLENAAAARGCRSPVANDHKTSRAKRDEMMLLLSGGALTIIQMSRSMRIAKSTTMYLRNDLEEAGLLRKFKGQGSFTHELTEAGRAMLEVME